MRAVVTRVKSASVEIDGNVQAAIGKGFLVLLGVHVDDTEAEAKKIADKICGLRVFEDEAGKMNVNPLDAGAELLIVSQFTLYADCKSRRPGFTRAARPETAIPLYELVVSSSCRNAAAAASPSAPASSARRCRYTARTTDRLPFCWIRKSYN